MKLSVIIRNKNEGAWIGHCIQSLLENFIKPEIIIVDNNSKDESLEIVKNFQEDKDLLSKDSSYTDIKILSIDNYTPGLALNLGVKNCSNDYVLIISAHCVIYNLDTEKLLKNFENYNCFYGNQIPVYRGKKIKKRYIWANFTNTSSENFYSKQEERYFLHNAFAFYKKSFLVENPFDENLAGKEDRYWANHIIKNDHKIFYDSSQSVLHHYTSNGATWKGIG